MAASKSQANWTTVAHATTSITRVNSVSISKGGKLSTYKGDGDRYPSVVTSLESVPKITVTTGDIAAAMGLEPGAEGTFTATHKDAKKAAHGDIIYTVSNTVVENVDTSGNHGDFGTATITLIAYAVDGTTNPISIARD